MFRIVRDVYTTLTGGVLAFATYYDTDPSLEDGDALPFRVDGTGKLLVSGSGGSATTTVHSADGSEEEYVLDTSSSSMGMVTFYAPGGSAIYAIEESVDGTRWDEIKSGSVTADTLEVVRLSSIYGGSLKIKVISTVAVEVEAITKNA